jgi:hypothetical protein
MSNNPVNHTDPNGGWDDPITDMLNMMIFYHASIMIAEYGNNTAMGTSNNIAYKNVLGDGNNSMMFDKPLRVNGGSGVTQQVTPENMSMIAISSIGTANNSAQLAPIYIPKLTRGIQASFSQGNEARALQQRRIQAFYDYGGDGSGSFADKTMKVLNDVRVVSPLTQINDAANIALYGTDSRGIPKNGYDAVNSAGNGVLSIVTLGMNGSIIPSVIEYQAAVEKEGYSTIYRAVSQAEVDDVAKFGFRVKEGGYESGKLFAPTLREATQFGRYNFGLDGIPNTIMKVRVPNSVLNTAIKFGADGMNAISIDANHLHLLKGTPLNFSTLIR